MFFITLISVVVIVLHYLELIKFVSIIATVEAWFRSLLDTKTQLWDKVRGKLVSKLIKNISKVLQYLLKYFNYTAISTFLVPSLPV